MLLLLLLREFFPVVTLFGGQTLPLLADHLGEIGLTLLLAGGVGRLGLTIFAALATEEDECVFWPLDIVLIAFLGTTLEISAARRLASFRGWRDGFDGGRG